jgi:hypothetical protein
MSLFNNPKKTIWAVSIFIILLVTALATRCHAAEAYTTFRVGSTALRGPTAALELSLATPVPYSEGNPLLADAHLEYGLLLIGSSTYQAVEQPNQLAVSVRYVDGFGPVDLGLGLTGIQHPDAYNSGHLNCVLLLGYHYKQFSVRYQHISNAGTHMPNLGRDMLLVGWSFK